MSIVELDVESGRMTDQEYAEEIKDLVARLNQGVAEACDVGLEVVFKTLNVGVVNGMYLERLDVSIRRPL